MKRDFKIREMFDLSHKPCVSLAEKYLAQTAAEAARWKEEDRAYEEAMFHKNSVMAIGWNDMGDLSKLESGELEVA